MIEVNSIIYTDYRGYWIDMNLADYFDIDNSNIDKQDRSFLNSRKLSHKTKFVEKLLEKIEIADL